MLCVLDANRHNLKAIQALAALTSHLAHRREEETRTLLAPLRGQPEQRQSRRQKDEMSSRSDLIGGGSKNIAVIPKATQVNNFQSSAAFISRF